MGMIYCFHHDGYVDTNDDAEVIYPDGTLESAKCSDYQDLDVFKSTWSAKYQWSSRGEI